MKIANDKDGNKGKNARLAEALRANLRRRKSNKNEDHSNMPVIEISQPDGT
jgi:hypothetical protein